MRRHAGARLRRHRGRRVRRRILPVHPRVSRQAALHQEHACAGHVPNCAAADAATLTQGKAATGIACTHGSDRAWLSPHASAARGGRRARPLWQAPGRGCRGRGCRGRGCRGRGCRGRGCRGRGCRGRGCRGRGCRGRGCPGRGCGAGAGAARAHIVAAAGPRGRAGRRRRRSRRARSPARALLAQRPGRLLLGACAPARVLSWSMPKAAP